MQNFNAKVVRYFKNEEKYGTRPVVVLQFKTTDDLTGIEVVKTRYYLLANDSIRLYPYIGKTATVGVAHSDKLDIDVLVSLEGGED